MIKELITYLLNTAKRHKAVNYVGYKREININDQNNTRYYQFIIENECFLEKQLVEGILTLRLDIDCLGFVTSDLTPLDVQDTALHIILDFMEYINNDSEYYNLEVRDYSIVSFSEYTDDNSAGVRATIQFIVPNPINICEYESNFIDKDEEDEIELDINIDNDECTNTRYNNNESNLILNPIKLK